MQIISHGGGCCGISHIFSMGNGPSYECAEILKLEEACKKYAATYAGHDFFPNTGAYTPREGRRALEAYLNSHSISFLPKDTDATLNQRVKQSATQMLTSYGRVYWIERPKETAGDRLKAYLQDIERQQRTSGLVEIVLAGDQISGWEKFLTELNFVKTTSFLNSNSGRTCAVFHLAYGKHNIIKPAKKSEATLNLETL